MDLSIAKSVPIFSTMENEKKSDTQPLPTLAKVFYVDIISSKAPPVRIVPINYIKDYMHGSSEVYYNVLYEDSLGGKYYWPSQVLATGDTEEEVEANHDSKRPSKTTSRKSAVEIVIDERNKNLAKNKIKPTANSMETSDKEKDPPSDDDFEESSGTDYQPEDDDYDDAEIDTMEFCLGSSRGKTTKRKARAVEQKNHEDNGKKPSESEKETHTDSKKPNNRKKTDVRKPKVRNVTDDDREVIEKVKENNPLDFGNGNGEEGGVPEIDLYKKIILELNARNKVQEEQMAKMQEAINMLAAEKAKSDNDQHTDTDVTHKMEESGNNCQFLDNEQVHPKSKRKLGYGGSVNSEKVKCGSNIIAPTEEANGGALDYLFSESQQSLLEDPEASEQVFNTDDIDETRVGKNDDDLHRKNDLAQTEHLVGDGSSVISKNSRRSYSEASSSKTESNEINENIISRKQKTVVNPPKRKYRIDSDSSDEEVVDISDDKGVNAQKKDDDDVDDETDASKIDESSNDEMDIKEGKKHEKVKIHKKPKRDCTPDMKSMKKPVTMRGRLRRKIPTGKNQLDIDYFTEEEQRRMADAAKLNKKEDFTEYEYPNPKDPKKPIKKYHLCFGIEIPMDSWELAIGGSIGNFLRQILQSIHTTLELGNKKLGRAHNIPGRSPRSDIDPLLMAVTKKTYIHRCNLTLTGEAKKKAFDNKFWRGVVSSAIGNCSTIAKAEARAKLEEEEKKAREARAREAGTGEARSQSDIPDRDGGAEQVPGETGQNEAE